MKIAEQNRHIATSHGLCARRTTYQCDRTHAMKTVSVIAVDISKTVYLIGSIRLLLANVTKCECIQSGAKLVNIGRRQHERKSRGDGGGTRPLRNLCWGMAMNSAHIMYLTTRYAVYLYLFTHRVRIALHCI